MLISFTFPGYLDGGQLVGRPCHGLVIACIGIARSGRGGLRNLRHFCLLIKGTASSAYMYVNTLQHEQQQTPIVASGEKREVVCRNIGDEAKMGGKEGRGSINAMNRMACKLMPEQGEDTDPVAQAAGTTGAMPSAACSDGDDISAAADQLASVELADGSGTTNTDTKSDDDKVICQDPELWKPHPPTEDCLVCLVPLPLSFNETTYFDCCGKLLCCACVQEHVRALRVTNAKRDKKELPPLALTCAFCRTPAHHGGYELLRGFEARMQKGDAWAAYHLARRYQLGVDGLPRDEAKALELYQRAADQGSVKAIGELGQIYFNGKLKIDGKFEIAIDRGKGWKYMKDAAKKGCVVDRSNLGTVELHRGNHDHAIRHWTLAAEAGYDNAVKKLWKCFFSGKLSKSDLENTLRAHQASCDDMNSEDRERLAAMKEAKAGNDEFLKRLYQIYYDGEINAKELKKTLKAYHGGK